VDPQQINVFGWPRLAHFAPRRPPPRRCHLHCFGALYALGMTGRREVIGEAFRRDDG
jgi:hypothetical protein